MTAWVIHVPLLWLCIDRQMLPPALGIQYLIVLFSGHESLKGAVLLSKLWNSLQVYPVLCLWNWVSMEEKMDIMTLRASLLDDRMLWDHRNTPLRHGSAKYYILLGKKQRLKLYAVYDSNTCILLLNFWGMHRWAEEKESIRPVILAAALHFNCFLALTVPFPQEIPHIIVIFVVIRYLFPELVRVFNIRPVLSKKMRVIAKWDAAAGMSCSDVCADCSAVGSVKLTLPCIFCHWRPEWHLILAIR